MATLKYDFQIVGAEAISRAFNSLERRAAVHNRRMERMFSVSTKTTTRGGASSFRGGSVPSAAKEAARETAAVNREIAKRQNEEIRAAKKVADAKIREARRAANAAVREEKRVEREQLAQVRRKRGTMLAAASSLGQRAVGYAAMGGGLLLGGVFAAGRETSREARYLALQSKTAGNKASMSEIFTGVLGTSKATATRYGVEQATVLKTMRGFHGIAGRLEEGAKPLADFMTAVSEISGAAPEDIGRTTGTAYMHMVERFGNPEMAQKYSKQLIGALAVQAAEQSIEMEDFAKYGPRILAATNKFKGGEKEYANIAAIVAQIAQLAPQGSAIGAAEATIAIKNAADELVKNRDVVKNRYGMDITSVGPGGIVQLNAPEDVFPAMFAKTKGDPAALAKIGLDKRANRAIEGMANLYVKGIKEGDKRLPEEMRGAKAIRDFLMTGKNKVLSPEQAEQYLKDIADADPFLRLEKAINNLVTETIPKLVPAVGSIAESLAQATPTLVRLLEGLANLVAFFAENPFQAVIAALVAQVTAANLAELLRELILGKNPASPQAPGGTPKFSIVAGTQQKPSAYNPFAKESSITTSAAEEAAMSREARLSGQGMKGSKATKIGGNVLAFGPLVEGALNWALMSKEEQKQGYGVFDKYLYRNTFEEYQRKEAEKQAWLDKHPFIKSLVQPTEGGKMPSWFELGSSTPMAPGDINPADVSSRQMLDFLNAMNAQSVEDFTSALQKATASINGMNLNRGETPGQPNVSSGGR